MQDRIKVKNKTTGEIYPTPYELVKEIHLGMGGEIDAIVIAKYLPDGEWKFEKIPGSDVEILEFDINEKAKEED